MHKNVSRGIIMRELINSEKGIIMPIVILALAITTLLGFTAAFVVENQSLMISHFSKSQDALYYAEAGYNKYLWHLNKDSTFYQTGTGDGLVPIESERYANGYPWKYYPTPYEAGHYQLSIDPPEYVAGSEVDNFLTVTSTGWTNDDPTNKQTIQIKVQKRRFVQHGMVANDERDEDGTPVYWISGEVFYGPFHTNGTLFISGTPIFNGPVTYVNAVSGAQTTNTNIFKQGATQADPLTFPTSNSDLLAWGKSSGGRYYNGRTCIMLKENSYDVRTYDADANDGIGAWKYNDVTYTYTSGIYTANGVSYSSFEAFANTCSSLSLPENGVIYVNGSTYTGTNEKNCWDLSFGNVFVSGKLQGRLTIAAANNIYITGYNPTLDWNDTSRSTETGGVTYDETSFTQVFDSSVWQYTQVNVQSGYTDTDLLGLLASNKILILHYGWPGQSGNYFGNDVDVAPQNISINAALFALNYSFGFQNAHDNPAKGTITMVGSITQKYRGGVGTFSGNTKISGYTKAYSHDPRMLYDSPPHFIDPVNSGWKSVSWTEIANP